ncbi:MAG: hypothetical protein V3V23_06630, partial [Dehalococcoidales bacterium]
REKAERIGFSPSFTIMDRSDMEEAARGLISEVDGTKMPMSIDHHTEQRQCKCLRHIHRSNDSAYRRGGHHSEDVAREHNAGS